MEKKVNKSIYIPFSLTNNNIPRYFLLKDTKLFFAKDITSAPHGMIDLTKCMTVKSADIKFKEKYSIQISTSSTTYYMYADSEKEKDDWIGVIGRAIVQSSATYTNFDGKEDDGSDCDV